MPVGFEKFEFFLYLNKCLLGLFNVVVDNGEVDNRAKLKQALVEKPLFRFAACQQ